MQAQIQWPWVIVLSTFVFTGCAVLQQTPAVAVHPARLACPDAPQIVDGNLETVGALATHGYIEKRVLVDYRRGQTLVNERQVVGTKRAGAMIVVKELAYITHIDVYAESAITEPLIDVATDKSLAGPLQFIPIRDPQIGKPIKPGQMRRFRVGQKIRYLRIMTDAVEDMSDIQRSTVVKTQVTRIPLKGPTIREIKLYEIPTDSQ